MNFALFLGVVSHTTLVVLGVCASVAYVMVLMAIWASRYAKVGPDEILVVSGRRMEFKDSEGKTRVRGYRIVKGGGTFVWPIYEQAGRLSLKPVSLDLVLAGILSHDGSSVEVVAESQVRIGSDDQSIARAAESLLNQSTDQIGQTARQLLESSLRSLLATRTTAQLSQGRSELAGQWQEAAKPGLAQLGLQILSLSISESKVGSKAAGVL